MGNSNKPWTADEDRRLLQLCKAGRSLISAGAALKRSRAAVKGRLSLLRKRTEETTTAALGLKSPELKSMATFDPSEPAILHDRLTDKIETWTGEYAVDYSESAISRPDGTVEWRQFTFDGWGSVLGG